MEWAFMPLQRYADFSGRSRRKEYWMFQLLIVSAIILLIIIGLALAGLASGMDGSGGASVGFVALVSVGFILWLGSIVPSIAVQVRRFHDQNHSGWMVLLNFIPYIGWLVVLVFMCIEGTNGANRYGPDPKAGEPGHDAHAHLAERFS